MILVYDLYNNSMMLAFTEKNCITEALISPGPIFISGL